jgi:glutamate-1-semialdehyde aminotransferase
VLESRTSTDIHTLIFASATRPGPRDAGPHRGCRAEYRFQPTPATNGSSAHAAGDPALEAYLHLYLLNRGVLITPFHNMVLVSPDTSVEDIERHNELFTAAVDELAGSSPSP